jgi:tetratricopeptide (TPR) repeat protein
MILDGSRKCEVAGRAVEIYESLDDPAGMAWARFAHADGLRQMGRLDEAMRELAQALVAMRGCKETFGITACLELQAGVNAGLGRLTEANDLFAQSLAMHKTAGHEIGIATTLGNIAEIEFASRHPEEALRACNEALAIKQRRAQDSLYSAINIINSAAYRIALNDLDGAAVSAREGLRIARHVQSAAMIPVALQHLALLNALQAHLHRAAQLLGYVDVQLKTVGYERETTEKWSYDKLMSTLREQLSEAEIEKLASEGAAWSEDQAVEEALKV